MATYQELHELSSDQNLIDKVETAILVAAFVISSEPSGTANNTNRLLWAKSIADSPRAEAKKFLRFVLAANKSAPKATIRSATDSAIQTNVDAVVNLFANGL